MNIWRIWRKELSGNMAIWKMMPHCTEIAPFAYPWPNFLESVPLAPIFCHVSNCWDSKEITCIWAQNKEHLRSDCGPRLAYCISEWQWPRESVRQWGASTPQPPVTPSEWEGGGKKDLRPHAAPQAAPSGHRPPGGARPSEYDTRRLQTALAELLNYGHLHI